MPSPPPQQLVDVVVEVPRGSRNKYEYDERRGVMRFDRRLVGSIGFPADYGYVADTLGTDGDALDALVLMDEPTYPGVWVTARPVGVSWLGSDGGREAKLLCVPDTEPAYMHVQELEDLPEHVRDEIGQFFAVYQQLGLGGGSSDEGQDGRAAALEVLEQARRRWRAARTRS